MLRFRLTVAALIIASLSLHAAASAAPTGLAYDAVTKFATNGDASAQQPGDFNADFTAAASSQMPDQGSGGGFFGKIQQAAAMAHGMEQMMKTGIA
ncbi:MAG: hypothetical protein JO146_09140, partial [Candidatus Eremiobacteraeota bacterium]|nr:hypothetical protein [Candidatus Eremiobacteraeota bacterium]